MENIAERTQYWNFKEANVHAEHRIHNLHTKYNTNFKFELINLCNLKIFVANITIKLRFLRNS